MHLHVISKKLLSKFIFFTEIYLLVELYNFFSHEYIKKSWREKCAKKQSENKLLLPSFSFVFQSKNKLQENWKSFWLCKKEKQERKIIYKHLSTSTSMWKIYLKTELNWIWLKWENEKLTIIVKKNFSYLFLYFACSVQKLNKNWNWNWWRRKFVNFLFHSFHFGFSG